MGITVLDNQATAATTSGSNGVEPHSEETVAYKKYLEVALDRARKAVKLPQDIPSQRVEGEVLRQALINTLNAKVVIGQVATHLLWTIYLKGYYHWLGGEYDTLREWADAHITAIDSNHVERAIHVIERIFVRVYAWEKSGKGLPDPVNPEHILTVEDLIARPGLVKKLRESSPWVERADDDKARDIIADLANPKVSASQMRDKHGSKAFVLKHQIRYLPTATLPPNASINRINDDDETEEVIFVGMYMTPSKYEAFRRIAGEEGVEFAE